MDQNKMLTRIFLFLLLCIGNNLPAQNSIEVIEDHSISTTMEYYKRINRNVTHISGWRITVITTSDRRQVEETKQNFQKYFNYRIKTEYKDPYYHLKAGAFSTRNDATWALDSVKKKFPGAFLSVDKISYDEL